MDKQTAIKTAQVQLEQLLRLQPGLLAPTVADNYRGPDLANFCITFIETYAAWLEKQA